MVTGKRLQAQVLGLRIGPGEKPFLIFHFSFLIFHLVKPKAQRREDKEPQRKRGGLPSGSWEHVNFPAQ